MISTRLRIVVSADAIRLAQSTSGHFVDVSSQHWTGADPQHSLEATISDAQRKLRMRRPRATIVLDGVGVQVKRLANHGSARAALDAVRRNVRQYFLVGDTEPLITGPVPEPDGFRSFAAFDRGVCNAIVSACATSRVRISSIQAGVGLNHTALALFPRHLAHQQPVPSYRLIAAALALTLGIATAAAGPGIADRQRNLSARRELDALLPNLGSAVVARDSVEAMRRALVDVGAYANRRRSMVLGIATLTEAIPDDSFISELRLDTLGGRFVLIGPNVAALVEKLQAVPQIETATLVGTITPYSHASTGIERVTVQFRWTRLAP